MLFFNIAYYKTLNVFSNFIHPKNAYQVVFKADDLREPTKKVYKLDKIVKKSSFRVIVIRFKTCNNNSVRNET